MKNYSIVRIGKEYVVQADDKSILKIASRRRAARLVTDAAELLDSQVAPLAPQEARAEPAEPSRAARKARVKPDPAGHT